MILVRIINQHTYSLTHYNFYVGNKFQWNKEYFPVMSLEEYNKLKEAHAKENANE